MWFFRYKQNLNPLIAIVACLFIIIYGLVTARAVECSYFLAGVYIWLFVFGCYKSCLKVLPVFIVVGGAFFGITFAASGSYLSALSMVNRLGAVFLAAAVGMCIEAVSLTRALSGIHTPRSVTLGMLIATSFVPVLKAEVHRVREAMKTRGAAGLLNPKIFYRAFLVPFVMRLVGISDTLALSVETRGFTLGKGKYTVYKKEIVCLWDIVFLTGIVAGAVLAVVL